MKYMFFRAHFFWLLVCSYCRLLVDCFFDRDLVNSSVLNAVETGGFAARSQVKSAGRGGAIK